jgi:hypothetical protein
MRASTDSSLQRVSGSVDFEEWVNRILIKCPTTGKLIYTGFAMDTQTFEASPIEEMDPVECPACHQMHRWRKRDAILERETPTENQ